MNLRFITLVGLFWLSACCFCCKPPLQPQQQPITYEKPTRLPDTTSLPQLHLPIGPKVVMRTNFPKQWEPEEFDEVNGQLIARNPWEQALYDGEEVKNAILTPVGAPEFMELDTAIVSRYGRPFFRIDSMVRPCAYYRYGGETFVFYSDARKYQDSAVHEMVANLDYAYLVAFRGDTIVDRQWIAFHAIQLYGGETGYFYLDANNSLFLRDFDEGEVGGFLRQEKKDWDPLIRQWVNVPWQAPRK
jgi:hypothetical protein